MRSLLLLLFIIVNYNALAQKVTGIILDESKEPVEFAKIVLLKAKDSTVIDGAYANDDGYFEILSKSKDSIFIKCSFSGYKSYFSSLIVIDKELIEIGVITLEIDAQLLKETVVTGSLDALKAGIDKKVYGVDEDLMSRGGSVNDVLENIPSVDIDESGNISLRGDGNVTILIDGRPSALALGDGKNLLDAIPANSIERIEIVTNPSAKYDPDGTSGIINIVMKKNRRKGLNGLLSFTGATGYSAEGNAAISYRNKKWNFYANYSLNYYSGYRNYANKLYQVFNVDSTNFLDQKRNGTDYKMTNTLVFGTDYFISDQDVIGLSITGALGDRERWGDLHSFIYDQDSSVIKEWNREALDPREHTNADANINYSHKFDKDKGEFSIMASGSGGLEDIKGFYNEGYYDGSGNSIGLASLNQRLQNKDVDNLLTIQSDFNWIFDSINARIEVGAKHVRGYEYVSTFSETQDTISLIYLPDTFATFDYRYNEHFSSLYSTFGQELNKFKYQIGIRAEYAVQTPELLSAGLEFPNDYFNVFPSGHLRYDLGDFSDVNLSYSKRINRASPRNLNPFISYANPYNLHSGNPQLKPEYIDSYDLSYALTRKKVIMSFSLFHKRTINVIQRVRIYFPNNVSMMTFENVDKSNRTGAEVILILKPFSWMKNTLSFNGSHVSYIDADASIGSWNNDGYNWSFEYAGAFDFWNKTTTVQLNYKYRSPMVRPQGIVQPRQGLDISFEKRLLNNKLSVGGRVTDVFNQRGFSMELIQQDIWQYAEFKWLTRRFYITCSYKFGNFDDKESKMKRLDDGGGME